MADTDTASTTSSASTTKVTNPVTAGSEICIICAQLGSDKVVKDSNYQMMMDLYWKGILVDVKPEMNKKFDLCIECFDNILQFYQINDVLVYFEARLKELQQGILSQNLRGILTWQNKGLQLNKVQIDILKEWGTKLEPSADIEASAAVLNTYQVTHTQTDEDECESQSSRSSSKKNSEEDTDVIEVEKLAVQNDQAVSAMGKKSPSKRNMGQSKHKGGGGPKKKKLRRGRSGDPSDDESDGSNFSDDVNISLTSEDDYSGRERSTRRPASEVATVVADTDSDKECPICLDKFGSSSGLQKHLRQHKVIVGANEGKFECRYCRQQFNRQAKLLEHKKTCNNDEDRDSS